MPTSGTFKHNWSEPGLHEDLVASMATILKPSADTLKEVADDMNKRGYKFTFHGLNQHLQKLRRGATDANGGSKTPRTPKTKNKEATPKSTPGKRKNSNADSSDDLEDTPSKKTKIKMEIIEGAQEMNGLE